MAALILFVFSTCISRAQDDAKRSQPSRTKSNDVTILYDAYLHEFTCWSEGRPDADPNSNWNKRLSLTVSSYGVRPGDCDGSITRFYPYKDSLYFFDDQRVWIELVGAHLGDLFSAQAPNTALTEPSLPIFGQVTTLPTFSELTAGGQNEANIPTTTEEFVYQPKTEKQPQTPLVSDAADQLYEDLGGDPTTLQSHLQTLNSAFGLPSNQMTTSFDISDPIPTQLPVQILSESISTAVRYFQSDSIVSSINDRVASLSSQIESLKLGDSCEPPLENSRFPNPSSDSAFELLAQITDLTHIVESETALYQQLSSGQYTNFTQTLTGAVPGINRVTVSRLREQSLAFADFTEVVNKAFRGDTNVVAAAIQSDVKVVDKHYSSPSYPDFSDLLDEINRWSGATSDTDASKIQTNLRYLLARMRDINAIATAFKQLTDQAEQLDQATKTAASLQHTLNRLGEITVAAAHLANCRLEKAPLPHPYDYFSLGVWYSSQTINVTLLQGTRVPPFNLTTVNPLGAPNSQPATTTQQNSTTPQAAATLPAGQGTTATPLNPSGGTPTTPSPTSGTPQQATSTSPTQTTSPVTVRLTTFAIHGRYRWLLGGGVASGIISHYDYTIFTQTPTQQPGTTLPQCAATTNCLYVQRTKSHLEVFPTLDVVYLFRPQDPFPYSFRGKPDEYVPRFAQGLCAGFDIADPGRNFLFGWTGMFRTRNSSVLNGIGLKAGVMVGQSQHVSLPAGAMFNEFFLAPQPNTVAVGQKWNVGGYVGLTVSAVTFGALFGGIFK